MRPMLKGAFLPRATGPGENGDKRHVDLTCRATHSMLRQCMNSEPVMPDTPKEKTIFIAPQRLLEICELLWPNAPKARFAEMLKISKEAGGRYLCDADHPRFRPISGAQLEILRTEIRSRRNSLATAEAELSPVIKKASKPTSQT